MSHEVVDLNDSVLKVRRLRAAAALPKVLAFILAVLAGFLGLLQLGSLPLWVSLGGSAALLALLGRGIEHGVVWAVWLLALLVSALTALAIAAAILTAQDEIEESVGEFMVVLAGLGLTLAGCWILVRLGLMAVWRQERLPTWIVTESRRGWSPQPRGQRWRVAFGTFTAAAMIYVLGAVVAAAVAAGTGMALAGALSYLPLARLAGRVWTKARRKVALRVRELRQHDTRPPILLLRSFDDDNLPLETRFRVLWFFSAAKEAFTLEEYIVNCLWRQGPVIAIGNPRETLSPLGAAREYVPDDRWRAAIHEYLDEAVLVVSILGSTPGLRWEYEAISAQRPKRDVVVVFPPRPIDQLHRRWTVLKAVFAPAAGVELAADSRLGMPLLAAFSSTDEAARVFYCRFNNETAYGVAFAKLFAN